MESLLAGTHGMCNVAAVAMSGVFAEAHYARTSWPRADKVGAPGG